MNRYPPSGYCTARARSAFTGPVRAASGAWRRPERPQGLRRAGRAARARGRHLRPPRVPCLKGEITALVMPTNGVTNGPCNTSNPSNLTACFGDTAALTLSCVPPGQDRGVAPPGRRFPASLPPRQGNWPFYPILPTPREARIGETQIPFGGSRSHRAAAPTVADRHQLVTAPRAARSSSSAAG